MRGQDLVGRADDAALVRRRVLDDEHAGVAGFGTQFVGAADKMKESGINLQVHYIPVHLQPFYKKFGFRIGDFPEAESYARNAISLPLFPGLSKEEIYFCVDRLSSLI